MASKMFSADGTRVFHGNWVENPHRPVSWHDDVFYAGPQVITGVGECVPVTVKGYWSDPWFEGWPGVGYSPAPFKMKALRAGDGRIFRPSANRTGYAVLVKGVPESIIAAV